ncbi:MAG: orotidine-5'-phosphate decarboxylase [Myxococcota bacterium]
MPETEPFGQRLLARVRATAPACVGLDPFPRRLGLADDAALPDVVAAVRRFCLQAVEAVAGVVPVVKPQSALFEQLGPEGLRVLVEVVAAAREAGLLVLVDGKRGDIGSTAEAYARAQLDDDGPLGADAVTVSPYLGPESLAPYGARTARGKGVFVLVRTSNPGARAWQGPICRDVAAWIDAACPGPGFGPVGAVVGATLPADEVAALRAAMPRTWFLVPGFGAQGAGVEEVRPHFLPDGTGALVTASRSVLFPADGVDADPVAAVRDRARRLAEAVAR